MIASLMGMALALITAAQQPNVPVELRTQALLVASQVISFAQNLPSDTPAPAPTVSTAMNTATPTFGSVTATAPATPEKPTCSMWTDNDMRDGFEHVFWSSTGADSMRMPAVHTATASFAGSESEATNGDRYFPVPLHPDSITYETDFSNISGNTSCSITLRR